MKTIMLMAALVGCAIDEDYETTEQAVSNTSLQTHTCYQDECFIPLSGTRCMLAGIVGGLGGNVGVTRAKISHIGGGPMLHIQQSWAAGIEVRTVCMNGVTGAIDAQWDSHDGEPTWIPSAGRTCFLTGITNTSGQAFTAWETNVQVAPFGDYHVITGNVPSGRVIADVMCLDVTPAGSWSYANGSWSAVSGDLAKNPRSGGVACALTGIGGKIDWAGAGVEIGYGNWQWSWSFSVWSGGGAACFL
jgi:hypothetical protein